MTTATLQLSDLERRDLPMDTDYKGKPERTLHTEWVVKTGDTPDGDPYEVVVQVTTSHYGKSQMYGYPGKQYRSRFGWIIYETNTSNDGSYTYRVTKWGSDHKSILLGEVPTERYAKKALEAAHAEAVATTLALYQGSNLEEVTTQAAAYTGSRW